MIKDINIMAQPFKIIVIIFIVISIIIDIKMVLEEIYRFPNGMTEENGQRCWNVKALFRAILEGM